MNWMVSANPKKFNHVGAFERWGFIDWKQSVNFQIGDTVYLYCVSPIMRIRYKTVVVKESMSFEEKVDDLEFRFNYKGPAQRYARLKLVEEYDLEELSLNNLMQHGLKIAPQGAVKLNTELLGYIEYCTVNDMSKRLYPETDLPETYYEGAVQQALVNRYERNPDARRKCIEYHGYRCSVCDVDFEVTYGEIGRGFIHVHHLIPIHEIGEEYEIDSVNDLIPVCPNCHAMLHRKINGKQYTWQELKTFLKTRNSEQLTV